MTGYIIRRVLLLIPTIWGVVTLTFVTLRLLPGDVARLILSGGSETEGGEGVDPAALAALRERLGLDRPLIEQYLEWLQSFATLDLGSSLYSRIPVWDDILRRLPYTVELAVIGVVMLLIIAIPAGVISAVRQNSRLDYGVRVTSIIGLCIPSFWLGTLVIIGLVRFFDWLPPLRYVPIWQDPVTNLTQLMWPGAVIGVIGAALTARLTRSGMLEVLGEDYIRTAWAKGLTERAVLYRHALRNAMLPIVTIVGAVFAGLLGGTVVIESVFNVPGLGLLLITAIQQRDYPVIQGVVVVIALFVTVMNLVVDISYAWLDPRIRYG